MKKIYFFISLFSVFNFSNAQVGINTTSPKASLDIQINNATNPTNEDGILIPRIDTFPSSNPTTDQNAMLVYLTTSVGANNPGFYYWDNASTTWIGLQKAGAISKITDTDLDTQIQVEESADDDTIRFDIAGTEYFTMKNGRINILNNGESVFIGQNAGLNDDFTNNYNTAIGSNALFTNTTGNANTAIGRNALYSNNEYCNTAVGNNALKENTSGYNSSVFGFNALTANVSGFQNVVLGAYAMYTNVTGSNNTVIGMNAGRNATGSNNVFLGIATGKDATGDGNVFLGSNAGFSETGSNKLYIDNSNTTSPLIYGEFNTNYLQVNGNFDVGTSGDGTVARANAWNTFSDRRWKTNFKKIENSLDKLNQINGYYYNWKDKKDQSLQVGVIAQEIEAVLPEIVSTDKNGYKSVDYSKISALLIQVAKEQQTMIESQEIKIEELSKKYSSLLEEIENIKKLLSSKN